MYGSENTCNLASLLLKTLLLTGVRGGWTRDNIPFSYNPLLREIWVCLCQERRFSQEEIKRGGRSCQSLGSTGLSTGRGVSRRRERGFGTIHLFLEAAAQKMVLRCLRQNFWSAGAVLIFLPSSSTLNENSPPPTHTTCAKRAQSEEQQSADCEQRFSHSLV